MKYIGKPIDTEKYFLYDIFSRENGIFQYRARVPQNEEERKITTLSSLKEINGAHIYI